jgi:hypothetical protein
MFMAFSETAMFSAIVRCSVCIRKQARVANDTIANKKKTKISRVMIGEIFIQLVRTNFVQSAKSVETKKS